MPTQHWYKIPAATIAKAKKNGCSRCPTEIALRSQTGEDIEQALAGGKKNGSFATRKVVMTLCGISYDEKCDPAKRLVVSRASDNPELFPDYVFASLPAPIVTMLVTVFAEINDPDEDELENFKKSHSAIV